MSRPVSGSKGTGKQPPAHPTSASGVPASQPVPQRTAKTATKHPPKIGTILFSQSRIVAHPETKTEAKPTAREAFVKKVQVCMNTYNYADETADVKGKVNLL